MATINIGADNQGDAFYRYKMPRLVARVGSRLFGSCDSFWLALVIKQYSPAASNT